MRVLIPKPPYTYTGRIIDAQRDQSPFLVVDRLDMDTAQGIFETANSGKQVLTQHNTILRGASIIDDLINQGVNADLMDIPVWVVAVKRLTALCPECRVPTHLYPAEVNPFTWQHLDDDTRQAVITGHFYRSGRCAHCQNNGRAGEILGFDIFHYEPNHPSRGRTLISIEYIISS